VVTTTLSADRLLRTAPAWGRFVPRTLLGEVVAHCFPHLPPDLADELHERLAACVVLESSLALVHYHVAGRVDDYGIVCRRVVTDAGVALIVDALDNTLADATIKYHGLGTGGTAEAASQTALVTELTTEYNPNSTRATGTFSQPSANISQSVATNTVDAAAAVTEHGVFTQAATGGGTMLDRSLFSVINLANGDSLQSTYSLTLTSGG
jgi:hypothetical protein